MVLLGKNGLLTDVKINLRMSDWNGGLPIKWDYDSERLEIKSRQSLNLYRFRLSIVLIYFSLAFIQVIRGAKGASLLVITHTVIYLGCAILNISCILVNYTHLPNVIEFFNRIISYERGFERLEAGSSEDLGIKAMVFSLTASAIAMPVLYHLDIIRNPCLPLYVGYWMSEQCQDEKLGIPLEATWSGVEVGTKLIISGMSYINWSFMIVGAYFQMSLAYVVFGHCLRRYIFKSGTELLLKRKEDTKGIVKSTLAYRQLQIFCIQYRLIYSRFMIGVSIPCLMGMQTICLYNTISILSGKDTGGSLFSDMLYAWSGVVLLFCVIYMFGVLADVHNVSSGVQRRIDGELEFKQNKWLKRWLRSCPVLRIYFGGSNYLDRQTPLKCEDFVINQTVSLLLLNN